MYSEILAKNLQELLKGKSLSQTAKEIGIPQQTLYRYVHNQREIKLENLVRIANYFDEDLDTLVGRKP